MRDITVTAHFASTHRLVEAEGPHLHGHTFGVQATELGTEVGGVKYDLLPDLQGVLVELHLHNLDEMLMGGSQTLDGIGAWIMERLILRHPRLVRVEVWMYDQTSVRVGVTREIR